MFKKRTLHSIVICSLALVLFAIPCMMSFNNSKHVSTESVQARTTAVEISEQSIDYESVLNEFEDSKLETVESLTTFEGYQTLNLADFEELDNLSETNVEEKSMIVKYNFSYDSETNLVTLSAELKNELGEVEVDELTGVAFINDKNQIDAVMNVDGESILLSEMQDAGMIQNCGWFKKLVKKVVKVAVVTVTAVAVVATTAAVVVATAGAAAPALVAAGVGITTSATIGAAAGVAAGALFYATVGQAALQAGTAISEPLGEGASAVIDRATNAILEITYKGVKYASAALTAAAISKLSKNAYYIAFAEPRTGKMYYTPTAINRDFALSIMAANTTVSVYTYYESNARSIAQQAGNNMSPIWERHHNNGYFDHYHLGNLSKNFTSHEDCYSHAFYGLPQFN